MGKVYGKKPNQQKKIAPAENVGVQSSAPVEESLVPVPVVAEVAESTVITPAGNKKKSKQKKKPVTAKESATKAAPTCDEGNPPQMQQPASEGEKPSKNGKKQEKETKNSNVSSDSAQKENPIGGSGKQQTPPVKGKKRSLKAFLRRYWYWFVAVPLLVTVSFVWLYFIGAFDSVNAIVIKSSTPKDINMPVDSMYHIVVTSDSDIVPTYSTDHPSIVEVTRDGYLISHKEGTAVVTVAFGTRKKYEVAVTVSSYYMVWYLTTGDSFYIEDVYATFPGNSSKLKNYDMKRNEYLDIALDEDGKQYFYVKENVPADCEPVLVYVSAENEQDSSKIDQKGVLTIFLVPTEEEKTAKMATYQDGLIAEGKLMDVPDDQVDEELEFSCGAPYELHPKLTAGGFVQFFLDGLPDPDFPVELVQTGKFAINAMLPEFYIIAVVDNKEAYRYKCKAVPTSTDLELEVGDRVIMEDYRDMMGDEQIRFSADSPKLEEYYDEAGAFVGFTATQSTEGVVHIDCSSYEDRDYVTYRFNVVIKNKSVATYDEEAGGDE